MENFFTKEEEKLFAHMNYLTDVEFDTDQELRDIEALLQEEANTYHLSGNPDCLCQSCVRDHLQHWQELMTLLKMTRRQIKDILEF